MINQLRSITTRKRVTERARVCVQVEGAFDPAETMADTLLYYAALGASLVDEAQPERKETVYVNGR